MTTAAELTFRWNKYTPYDMGIGATSIDPDSRPVEYRMTASNGWTARLEGYKEGRRMVYHSEIADANLKYAAGQSITGPLREAKQDVERRVRELVEAL